MNNTDSPVKKKNPGRENNSEEHFDINRGHESNPHYVFPCQDCNRKSCLLLLNLVKIYLIYWLGLVSLYTQTHTIPVGWCYMIHLLHLFKEVRPSTSDLDMQLNHLIPNSFRECRGPLHCHCSIVHPDMYFLYIRVNRISHQITYNGLYAIKPNKTKQTQFNLLIE